MEIGNHNLRAEQAKSGHRADADKQAKTGKNDSVGIQESSRNKLNQAILSSASEVSLSSGNKSLHLLYRSAIDSLNETLAPELGDNAIERAAETPEDFTPENTAERIASFALNFYSAYQGQHPEMSKEDSVNSFIELMSGAVEKGVNEARGILDGMGVLEGDVAGNIDKTMALIQERFEAFRELTLGGEETQADDVVIDE
ncbi:MAG: DUF5610 domain-containing protein [Chromatiales bacterium]|nr:DUF5610 domain-containing protein [Chromatiales bacterium]